MQTFAVLRRNGWESPSDLEAAAARSTAEGQKMEGDVRWIRTYVLAEPDGSLGTVCIYQGKDEETIRRHAKAADLPATEVLPIGNTLVVNPDPAPAAH